MAHVAVVIEGLLDPAARKGGTQDLLLIADFLLRLGHRVSVAALWAADATADAVQQLDPRCRFIRIPAPAGITNLRHAAEAAVAAVRPLGCDAMILLGFGTALALRGERAVPTIGLISLPEQRLILPRLMTQLAEPDVPVWRRPRQILDATVALLAAWRESRGLAGAVDLVLAQDPNHGRRHAYMGRRGWRWYPSPVVDNAAPPDRRPTVEPAILFLNAPGTHSLASFLYYMRHIQPHMHLLEGQGYALKLVGMDRLPGFVRLSEGVARHASVQGFVSPIEPMLQSSACLLMCSPIKVGASTRIKTALMCGTPAVIHPAVAIGLPQLRHDENCLIARSGRDFVVAMQRLLADAELRARIAAGARRTYEQHFTPGRALAFWDGLLRELGLGTDSTPVAAARSGE